MKTQYEIEHEAYAKLAHMHGNRWALAMLWTEPGARGKGNARKLLRQVLADADKQGIWLELAVMPNDATTRKSDLIKFYRSMGFEHDPGHGSMVRKPAPPQNQLFIRDGFILGVLAPGLRKCPICDQRVRVINVAEFMLPEGMTAAATILFDRKAQRQHTAIGMSCGCYARLHRQIAHITDSMQHRQETG